MSMIMTGTKDKEVPLKPNLPAYQKHCPDCGVQVGELHNEGCDIPLCTQCGIQLLQCEEHQQIGNSSWTGIQFQEEQILAEALQLLARLTDHGWNALTAVRKREGAP